MATGRPASAAMPTVAIAPEISPPGRLSPQKQQAAGGADDERLERAENLGAVGDGGGHRSGDQAHAALWQIRIAGQMRHAIAAMQATFVRLRHWPVRRQTSRRA